MKIHIVTLNKKNNWVKWRYNRTMKWKRDLRDTYNVETLEGAEKSDQLGILKAQVTEKYY